MKKTILIIMSCVLLIGVNVFAQGNLIVDGTTVVNNSRAEKITLGGIPGATQFPGIWFGPDTPTNLNYNFLYDRNGQEIIFNAAPGSNLLFSVGNNMKMKISDAGNVGIGTTNPTEKLYVVGNIYTVGNIYATGSITDGSSRELKENIRELSTEEAITALNNLYPQKFYYKADNEDEHVGFIAEDVPELVATKDRKGVSSMDVVAVLTKVVQEQQRMAEQQQRAITELKEEMKELKREMKLKGSMASVIN